MRMLQQPFSLPQLSSEMSYRLLVQGVREYAIYMLDTQGTIVSWNQGAQQAKGYEAAEIIGCNFECFYSNEDRRSGIPQHNLQIARNEGRFEDQGWRMRKDGSQFWAHVVIDRIHDDAGDFIGFAKITRDCTEQQQAALALTKARADLDLVLDHMGRGLVLFDAQERVVLHNASFPVIFGAPAGTDYRGWNLRDLCRESLNRNFPDRHVRESDVDELRALHVAQTARPQGGEVMRHFQSDRVVRVTHSPIGNGAWVTLAEDITEFKRSQDKVSYLANHDALTQLPNRAHYIQKLDAQIAATPAHGSVKLAVIGMDLNRFKEVNDTYGHAVGDKVLCSLAKRMSDVLQAGEVVARFGGDEFAAFKVYRQDTELLDFIHRIEGAVRGKVELDQLTVGLDAAIGISVYPTDASDRDKLLNNADLAMYRAKTGIEEKVCFYKVEMDETARARRAMARDIWVALEQKQFFLHYQVQRSLLDDTITGYEVLLRWQHPVQGLISPATFIPIAEECGAIIPIGEWVLETACREAAAWPLQHRIAVNLSPVQISSANLVNKIREVLADSGLLPAQLELEVTETAIIGDTDRALEVLTRIRQLGVGVALDDFGTGYSSFQTLRSFPFNKIKIDGSFISELENSHQSKNIVRAIIALGRSLGMPVLAECVETQGQMLMLRNEGCAEVQGYLFGRPDTLPALLNRRAA